MFQSFFQLVNEGRINIHDCIWIIYQSRECCIARSLTYVHVHTSIADSSSSSLLEAFLFLFRGETLLLAAFPAGVLVAKPRNLDPFFNFEMEGSRGLEGEDNWLALCVCVCVHVQVNIYISLETRPQEGKSSLGNTVRIRNRSYYTKNS